MRLIDVDERIETLEYHFDIVLPIEEETVVINFLNEAETIDAVQVVRCNDCRYYKPHTDCFHKDGSPICYCYNNNGMIKPKENDFCSRGKKKETED